eukprot:jgi/Chrzof1/10890/Cz05g16030.t1
MNIFCHYPETVLFAIDMDREMSSEATKGGSRFEVICHAIATFVAAKKKLCAAHRFGLVSLQECAVVHHDSISSNTDAVLAYLHHMRPSEQSYSQFDMGSLVAAVAPVQVCCSWRIFTTFASGHMQL